METLRGHVLLLGKIHEDAMQLLRSHNELTHEVLEKPARDEISSRLAQADALIVRTAQLSAEMMDKAHQLKIVARHGVGYDNVPVEVLSRKKIPLATTGNANAITVAEHALYLLLTLAKRGSDFDRAMREGDWESRNRLQGSEILGKNLLLVGFGRIGKEVAKRALAFGMQVNVFDPYVSPEQVSKAGANHINNLEAFLPYTDFLSLHLPFTPQNRHIIGAAEIKALPTKAYVINTARGGLIDEQELLKALDAGELAGAGLDCFEQEPPPTNIELLKSHKVVLSPHNASLTVECTRRLGLVCVENVVDALTGRLQRDRVVNWEAVYS
ncbi:MAG: hydroxyacid dehydrogenase [Deltaproteobacteria bacterium]|nr:hydroxyacid dehydrogenase [Deltaproteobacteria bacterium]